MLPSRLTVPFRKFYWFDDTSFLQSLQLLGAEVVRYGSRVKEARLRYVSVVSLINPNSFLNAASWLSRTSLNWRVNVSITLRRDQGDSAFPVAGPPDVGTITADTPETGSGIPVDPDTVE